MRARGFTLLEVLITVAIIAILAAVAIPSYRRMVERGYWRTAQDILQTIYSGEQAYESANTKYVDADNPSPDCPTIWECIYMDDPNTNVTYSVSGVTATAFTAKAQRQAGVFMTIDQDRNLDATNWPMP